MLYHVYNKPNKIKIFIYVYEGKAQIHSSNRLRVSGSTQNRNEKEKSISPKENIVPHIKKRLFVNKDHYSNKMDNSTILSNIQNKFSELCMVLKNNSNASNEKNILSVKANRLLTNCHDKVVNFKFLPFFQTKFQGTYQIYEQISGLDKTRLAQEKVSFEQEKLKDSQDRRRDVRLKLMAIRKRLQQIDTDKIRYARDDDRYLVLVKMEFDLTRDERELLERFEIANIEEREIFSHLTSVAKISLEQESSRTKTFTFWSRLFAVVGGLVGILATILSYRNNNLRIEKLLEEHVNIMKENEGKSKQLASESWWNYISRKAGSVYHFVRRDTK